MILTELSVKELEILKEGDDISPVAFRTLGWRGRHLVVGFAADKIPALPVNIALLKGASLVGVDSAQIRKWDPDVHARLTNEIATWLETKAVEPPPTLAFPFERFLELSTQSVRGELPARSSLS